MRDSAEEIAKGPSEWAMRVWREAFEAFLPNIRYPSDAQAAALVIDREVKALRTALLEEAAQLADANAHEECEVAEQIARWIRALKEPKP